MSVVNNPILVGLTGSILQKNAFAAYTKRITRTSSNAGTSKAAEDGSRTSGTDHEEEDTAIISREGIAALENARSISGETLLRHDNTGG